MSRQKRVQREEPSVPMSTPIYDDLCATMPAPSGVDEKDTAAKDDGGSATADRNGHVRLTERQAADTEQVHRQ